MTGRVDGADLVRPPHLPSWEDSDAENMERSRWLLGRTGRTEHSVPLVFDVDPSGNDWLDVVKGPETEDLQPKTIGEMMERLGSLPHFSVSFDHSKLSAIDVSEFASPTTSISQEKQEENLRRMLDVFSKLPELEFEHGNSYYIYGRNGSGKSVLSQAILVAVQRKWHELRSSTQEHLDKVKKSIYFSDDFEPYLPRALKDSDGLRGRELIMAVSDCIDVGNLVTAETSEREARARHGGDIAKGIQFSLWAAASTSMPLSGAQTVNSYLIDEVSNHTNAGRRRDKPDMTAVILDEPETSRDRLQLRYLRDEIENIRRRMGKNTIAIVPTHSEYIYRDPTALRIDLDNPDRGIHVPEDIDVVKAIDIDHLTPEQLLMLAEVAAARASQLSGETNRAKELPE